METLKAEDREKKRDAKRIKKKSKVQMEKGAGDN